MDPTPYYGPYQLITSTVTVNALALTVLVAENYNRVCLYLAVAGVNNIGVSPRSTLANGQGLVLSQNGLPWLAVRFAEDGPLVGQRWLGFSQGAAVVEVIEVIREREPGTKWVLLPELEYAQRELQAVYDPLGEFVGDAAVQPKPDRTNL